MRNRRPRSFRHRSNVRHFHRRSGDNENVRQQMSVVFSNGRKNNFKQYQSSEKLLERYKILVKEAQSAGDKIMLENYLQHVDHFTRIISQKNLNQNQSISEVSPITKNTNNETSKEKLDQSNTIKNK